MHLTHWTDYSLRVLMYCAVHAGRQQPVTITEIAEAHGISRSHLTKIVVALSAQGWLETTRGRGGGLRLLRPAAEVRLGDVVRQTETDLNLLECFDPERNTCRIDGHCRLKGVLHSALDSTPLSRQWPSMRQVLRSGSKRSNRLKSVSVWRTTSPRRTSV